MSSYRHLLARILCMPIVLAASGCAGNRPPSIGVLVPGSPDRASEVVPLRSDWFPATMQALRESPGCLGVEAAQTGSGKRVILAMFESKAAVEGWYRHPAHQALVERVAFYRQHEHVPATGVPENAGPILVIATMTPVSPTEGTPQGTMLLSVELFSPLPGGVRFGGSSLLPR